MEPVQDPCQALVLSPRMLDLYRDSTGHEAKPRRFWTALLNLFFPGANDWTISHEQFCHVRLSDGRQAYDTLLEYYDGQAGTHVPHCLLENKESSKSIQKAEEQARDYAKILLDERRMRRIFVVVAMGVSFRAYTLELGHTEMAPCFGPMETSKKSYLNVGTEEGYRRWYELYTRLTNESVGMQPPVLRSQPVVPVASPSDTSMASHSSSGSEDIFSNLADQDVTWVNITLRKKETMVHFDYGTRRFATKREKWKFVEHLGFMVCYLESENRFFGNRKRSLD